MPFTPVEECSITNGCEQTAYVQMQGSLLTTSVAFNKLFNTLFLIFVICEKGECFGPSTEDYYNNINTH